MMYFRGISRTVEPSKSALQSGSMRNVKICAKFLRNVVVNFGTGTALHM